MHIHHGKQLLSGPSGKISVGMLVVFILIAVVGPLLTADPMEPSSEVLAAPSAKHLLGTNDVGQDVFARLVGGARTTMLVALSCATISVLISALVGISTGLVGGLYSAVMMRLVDAMLVVPSMILAVLLSAFIQPGVVGIIVIISLLHWAGGARIIRSRTLSLRELDHITAAKSFGAGWWHITTRHIVPDLLPLCAVVFVHRARTAVFLAAGLAFIGIGDPSMVSWGTMIQNARKFYYLPVWKWWLLPPGICLSAVIIALVFIGHNLERTADPRLQNA
ncbi:MAG: ABC transporter permease [Planctomycetota bacterium]